MASVTQSVRKVVKLALSDTCTHPRAFRSGSALRRAFCAFSPRLEEMESSQGTIPRWKQPPKRMTMPFRVRPRPHQPLFVVNSDPEVLHHAYDSLVGMRDAHAMLPEELRWLAVTHKSFDHGRRGSNDKLAFLGKRIVDLECSLAVLNAPTGPDPQETSSYTALQCLENLSSSAVNRNLEKRRLAKIAQRYGIEQAMRWKPRKSDNLQSSGVETVLVHTLYSMIGALSLQRGAETAVGIVRKRILGSLRLRTAQQSSVV